MYGIAWTPARLRLADPVWVYVLLAFAGAWGIELLLVATGVRLTGPIAALWLILVSIIPGAAAVIAARLDPTRDQWHDLTRRTRTWRVGAAWYGIAIGLPLVTVLIAAAASVVIGIGLTWQPAILATIPLILAANFAEETGWRGFALPALLGRMGALRASLLLGLIWFIWHVPVQLLLPGEDKGLVLLALFMQLTGLSIVLTWLSLRGRGAVLLVAVAHASFNVAGNALPLVRVESQLLLGAACLVVAGVVASTVRRRDFGISLRTS
jgi:membrane protease YdiL (CAAX protease family)